MNHECIDTQLSVKRLWLLLFECIDVEFDSPEVT